MWEFIIIVFLVAVFLPLLPVLLSMGEMFFFVLFVGMCGGFFYWLGSSSQLFEMFFYYGFFMGSIIFSVFFYTRARAFFSRRARERERLHPQYIGK